MILYPLPVIGLKVENLCNDYFYFEQQGVYSRVSLLIKSCKKHCIIDLQSLVHWNTTANRTEKVHTFWVLMFWWQKKKKKFSLEQKDISQIRFWNIWKPWEWPWTSHWMWFRLTEMIFSKLQRSGLHAGLRLGLKCPYATDEETEIWWCGLKHLSINT